MPLKTPPVSYDLIRLAGGYDQVTPTLSLQPGIARDAVNFEGSITGGYTRIAGYERFDGRPDPSDATYGLITVNVTGAIAVGNTVTGVTSGVTGQVIGVSGGTVAYTKSTGTFTVGETLNVGGSAQGTVTALGAATTLTAQQAAQYQALAADVYRADIGGVPGSGQIRGVVYFNNVVYAWRNNAGGTAMAIYKSSSSGWTAVPLGRELSFTSGGLEYATGSLTLTGGASGSINVLTVNGVSVISAAVSYATSLTATAAAIAANINAFSSTPEYTATSVGATVTIRAATGGTGPNGFVVAATATTLTFTTANMAGGVEGTAIVEGNSITGATSGATATVTRVVLESGSWSAGTAAGRLIFASQTGTFAAENLNIAATTNRATIAGNSSAITLQPDGRVEVATGNFGGGSALSRVYGCDGVNQAFEFDGSVYAPIRTGMATDAPEHLALHKQHLFLSFGPSVQFSAIGDPYQWSPVLGAGEIVMSEDVTAFMVLPGDQSTGAMAVYTEANTGILYGSDSTSFAMSSYNVGAGARAYTAQNLASTYVFDDKGVLALQTTLNFGNFTSATLTANIRPFVQQRRNLATASGVNREKSQYRLFFSDGYGLYLTVINGKYAGAMPVLFPNPVMCMCEGQQNDGPETSFFGSTSAGGYVYRLDAGTSFDGAEVSANLELVFNSIRSPRITKRYRHASLEVTGASYAQFAFAYDLAYGSTGLTQAGQTTYATNLATSFWDSAYWDSFIWDGRTLSPSEVDVVGTAENIAVKVSVIGNYFEPFTLNSIILHYTPRRGLR